MRFVRRLMNQRVLVNLLSLLVVIWGTMALFELRREAFPLVAFDIVQVSTLWPGASAEEVETHVTGEIERELKDVDGIKEISSVSTEGRSVITITIHEDEANKDKVVNDIQRAVDRSKSDLPDSIDDDPLVVEITTKQEPVIEVSLTGLPTEHDLRQAADDLEKKFLKVNGVADVAFKNYPDREIWIEVDLDKLKEYYIPMTQIMEALSRRNLNISGGTIQKGDQEFVLRTMGEFSTPEEIEDVVIRSNDEGVWTKVGDVAEVRWAYEDVDLIERTNGLPSVNLVIPDIKARGKNATQVVKIVVNTALATSCVPFIEASAGDRPFSICLKIFSDTIMASSTSIPRTIIIANIVRRLTVSPNSAITPNVANKANGTPIAVISATAGLRNRSKHKITRTAEKVQLVKSIFSLLLMKYEKSLI